MADDWRMNTSDIIEALVKNFGAERTYSATKCLWHHGEISEQPPAEYHTGIQPGLDGSPCQIFSGESLEACLSKAIEYKNPTIEENNE